MKNKRKLNVANDTLATEITANNFFAHQIKEIDIKRLGDDIPILPTTNTINIYKYFNAMLKHLPKKALQVIKNDLLYSKKKLSCPTVKIDQMSEQMMLMSTIELRIISMKEFKNSKIN